MNKKLWKLSLSKVHRTMSNMHVQNVKVIIVIMFSQMNLVNVAP